MKWIVFLIFCFYSCSSSKTNELELNKSVFIEILTEMYIKESVLQYSDYLKKDSLNKLYNFQILEKHNTTSDAFLKDYEVYYNNKIVFDSLIEIILKRVSNKQKIINKDE